MSFTVLKNFSPLKSIFLSNRDTNVLTKLCIHCTAIHSQKDDKPLSGKYDKQGNPIGPPTALKSIPTEKIISKAMISYLERKQKSDKKMADLEAEYDLGRRHLANIMSLDEDELTPARIREAINYLLPSGLFNKKARPLMEHPSVFVPVMKGQEFDMAGRPYHYLYYTLRPNYYELMHTMAVKHESMKKTLSNKDKRPFQKIEDKNKSWIEFEQFKELFPTEKLNEHHYQRFLALIQRLYEHPLAYRDAQFFEKYLVGGSATSASENFNEDHLIQQDKDGRDFVIKKGTRKTARASVKLISQGHGHININGQDITHFDRVIHRQAILAPLQLCECIDKFDIEVRLASAGPSADAGAIRLAIARALLPFVHQELRHRLRLAGYLTRDPRVRERKKPGQEKARKKFTWKRR